jgi:uroporphyrinogen decarboxylase
MNNLNISNSPFLCALQHRKTEHTPIWLMRQAGRYMEIYRRLREKYSLLEMVKTPELACEVTLQPIKAFQFDAAIIFSDILPLLEGMGLKLEFITGEGPYIKNPIRTPLDVESLGTASPEECVAFTLDAIRLVRPELNTLQIPLIGFSGAPFTLASYAIEGSSSREHLLTKKFMHSHPEHWHMLMDKLSQMIGNYLLAQAQAGVQVLQIFDSWAGSLSPFDYQTLALPYIQKVIRIAKKSSLPIIYFSTGTCGFLNVVRELEVDAFSVDWRINLDTAWQSIGTDKAIQGNLDPALLFSPWPVLQKQAKNILRQAEDIQTNRIGFIFNLGHGILQKTPEDNVKRLVDFVKSYQ